VVRQTSISIPWELLHPSDPGKATDLKGFLGYNHLFIRRTAEATKTFRTASGARKPKRQLAVAARSGEPRIPDPYVPTKSDKIPEFGYIFDDGLHVNKLPAERRWRHRHLPNITFRELRDLDERKTDRAILERQLRSFVLGTADGLHMDCDAQLLQDGTSPATIDSVKIRIRSAYEATYAEVEKWRLRGNVDALFVLNFCHSGEAELWDVESVAQLIQKNGARSVVATMSKVNDAFAHMFAEKLYEFLLQSEPVGIALQHTRQHFADLHRNPACLSYVIHGAAGHVLDTAVTPGAAARAIHQPVESRP
jgi:hypothetical protein